MGLILALWEIQIEGQDGWAAKSPGWRIDSGWLMRLTGGLPITGYHVFMSIFMISIVHLPLFFSGWSWRFECLLLGFYVGMVLIEDFLWFILNPYYGIKNFKKSKIWWHKVWWGPVPATYWILLLLTAVLILTGSREIY
jgi:hypothetical protein